MGASIERELPVILSEEEKNESGRKCATKELELREVEQEKRDAVGGLNKRIKDLKKEIKGLALEAETGERKTQVPCEERTDWPNPTVVVRLDGRDEKGHKLPPGAPAAVVETKAPEVQEVEGDKSKAATPEPNPAQQDLFASSDGAASDPTTGGDADESVDEEEHEDEDEEGDAEEDAGAPPPAAAKTETKAANGRAPRRMKLVQGGATG